MFIKSYSDIQNSLDEFCQWASITQGRVRDYHELLTQLHVNHARSREALLSTVDLMDILDIYECWKINETDFPGIRDKIRCVIERGPILSDDENTNLSNNRPRNDLFVYLFAGKLIQAGIHISSIDGIPRNREPLTSHGDIISKFQDEEILIECKRPQKLTSINSATREARKQIQRTERKGCIALDCSKALRPRERVLDFSNDENAHNSLLEQMEGEVIPVVRSHLRENILGAFLMASVPGMKNVAESPFLSQMGTPIKHYTPFRVSSILIASNEQLGEQNHYVKWVNERLKSCSGTFGFVERP